VPRPLYGHAFGFYEVGSTLYGLGSTLYEVGSTLYGLGEGFLPKMSRFWKKPRLISGQSKGTTAVGRGVLTPPQAEGGLLTIADLLEGKARAEHSDYEPDLNFKKAKQEAGAEQKQLL
jgi:hypothetical protein